MKTYLIILFLAFANITYAQKSSVILHSNTEKKSNAKKIESYYNLSKLNLGIDLDLESWRDTYLRNYKVVIGYGKHNVDDILLSPYLSLGYRTMGKEFFSKNLLGNLRCNNYYSGLGLVFSKKRKNFLYALRSEVSVYSHEIKDENANYHSSGVDYNFSYYMGYILSKRILLYGQVEYNHRKFYYVGNDRKYSSRIGIAYKIQAL